MKKKESGLSLIEAAIVLALSAAVVSGVLYYYYATKERNSVLESTKGIQSIIAATQSLYGARGNTAGKISASAISAVSGITISSPSIATGLRSVFILPGKIAEAQYFYQEPSKSTVLTVHTASTDACMAFATLNFGTMLAENPRVLVSTNNSIGVSQYNEARSVSTPSDAASVCKDATNSKLAHILYRLKIQ